MKTWIVTAISIALAGNPSATFGQEAGGAVEEVEQPPQKKSQPRFEPREKFEPGSGQPAPRPLHLGDLLHRTYAGEQGTFQLCGCCGRASFLWPIAGETRRFEETMVYCCHSTDVVVYKLVGRYYRVCFAFAVSAGASGEYQVWVRNGGRPWRVFQSATASGGAQPPATEPPTTANKPCRGRENTAN